jgi:nitrogenase iron protein NifH
VICNSAGDEAFEMEALSDFAKRLGSDLIYIIPRSPIIQACEVENRTVLEHSPGSREAKAFQELAKKIMGNDPPVIPTPIEDLPELESMYRSHLGNAAPKVRQP